VASRAGLEHASWLPLGESWMDSPSLIQAAEPFRAAEWWPFPEIPWQVGLHLDRDPARCGYRGVRCLVSYRGAGFRNGNQNVDILLDGERGVRLVAAGPGL